MIKSEIFKMVRERVSAKDAAERYGLLFDRSGRVCCPFHNDSHPSMSFKNGMFRCWACNASGDSIDFTKRLFGLDAIGAVRKLNTDFCLSLPIDCKPTENEIAALRKEEKLGDAHKAFEEWRNTFILQLNSVCRIANKALLRGGEFTEAEMLAIRMKAIAEYYSDQLEAGSPKEQAQIFREREVLSKWIGKAVGN